MILDHCEMGFHGHFYAESFSGDSGIYTEEIIQINHTIAAIHACMYSALLQFS